MYCNLFDLYALRCTKEELNSGYCSVKLYVQGLVQMFKGWFKSSRVGSNVQGLVQMFKGWFKCSRVGSNVQGLEVKEVG
jgi:hypothetical protein